MGSTARAKAVEKEKELVWVGRAYKELNALSEDLRDVFGHALSEAQQGRRPANSKSMKGDLRDVEEIIGNDKSGTYRTMYTVKMKGVVYVLGSFQKRSKSGIATPAEDLDRIRARLKVARANYKNRSDY
ncbi:MAG: type II toxin-antitoxin system RelE/ParE family toxin [Gemmatimonadaceae bacterium]